MHTNLYFSVCEILYDHAKNPYCANNGTCFIELDNPTTPRCKCLENFTGKQCKVKKQGKIKKTDNTQDKKEQE